MITSLIEMLPLPSFGHLTTSTIQFESHDKTLLMAPWIKIGRHYLFSKMFWVEKEKVFKWLSSAPTFQFVLK